MNEERRIYIPPTAETASVAVECGFAATGDATPDNWENGETEWW